LSLLEPVAPQAIPVLATFPVDLHDGEERLFWERDRMHFPGQVLPLEAELVAAGPGAGLTRAFRLYDLPLRGMLTKVVHGRTYMAAVPLIAPPEELEELGRRAESKILPVILGLRDKWEREWLPEIREHIDALEALDLRTASGDELAAALDDARDRMARLWDLHMELILPAYMAVSEFDEFYRDLFDGKGFDAYRLLQGLDNKTVEVGRDLWWLSRVALRSPEVLDVLEREAAADVPGVLARSEAGRAFLGELEIHLAAYGHRCAIWGITQPSFIEDPSPVIKVLKDYVGRPDADSPAAEVARLAAEREAAVAQARERLEAYPAPVRAQFESMLEAAQTGLVLSEDHNFWIDFYGVDAVRQVILQIGRRLAAGGALDATEDVFWLEVDEIREAARATPFADRRALVATRRAQLDAYAGVTPPDAFGTMPAGPPPDGPATRLMAKFGGTPPAPSSADEVRGSAGSAGTVTGVARVVRSLQDAERLAPGEILVAETTAPPWTPLFAVAAAVVTDTGGVLSHCAVVAREYGIPAVVGAGSATLLIADGDVVEVDGDAGTVRIVR
jgi:phosphohistidine swiveling domain-containing protein